MFVGRKGNETAYELRKDSDECSNDIGKIMTQSARENSKSLSPKVQTNSKFQDIKISKDEISRSGYP